MDEATPAKAGQQAILTPPQTNKASLPLSERRQISVMQCTLSLHPALNGQNRSVALQAIVHAYRDMCTAVVQRYDGHMARALDEECLVYFGYPQAHENNAQQAVSAGLELLQALQQVPLRLAPPHDGKLTVRLGISAGTAIISGTSAAGQRPQIGLSITPNLGVRLGSLASPNTVVLCATTYQQVQGFFLCEAVPARFLRQLGTSVAVYRVVRQHPPRSAPDPQAKVGRTPLIGRQQEMDQLLNGWESAKTGAGQVIVLSGEAGIGKSRLLQALKEHIANTAHTLLEYRGSPNHQQSTLYAVIEHWQRLLQWRQDEDQWEKLRKLEVALAPYHCAGAEALPLFATLLSLPLPPHRYPAPNLPPQRQKQKTLEVLVGMIRETAVQRPVLVVVEDLHWIDPSTMEFLTHLLEHVSTHPLLIVFTHRPGFHFPWPSHAWLTQQTIGRLSSQQAEQMLTFLTGGKTLPAPLWHQLLAKAEGIPLFLEEFTKMLLTAGLLQEREHHYELTGPLPALAIPATLHDSLMARLDRLGTGKTVAQLAATLGQSFSSTLLQAVSPVDAATLSHALESLVQAAILQAQGPSSETTYRFKHCLLQEIAYQSLLPHTRQQYHRRIAEVFVERFPEVTKSQPELIAHHYTEAGLKAQAVPYWQQAGARASARSACTEAIAHLNAGLHLLATLPETPEHRQQELDIQTILGPALMAVQHPVAPAVEHAYARARALCQQVGTTPKLVWAIEGLWAFYLVRGHLHTARELGEQLLDLAQRLQTPLSFAVAHQTLGLSLFYLGELTTARTHLEEGVAHYALQEPKMHTVRGLHDPGVMCHAFAALASCLLGYPDHAMLRMHTMLQLAQELAHPYSLAFAHCAAAVTHQCRREAAPTQAQAEAAIAIATEQGFPLWAAMGTILRGWALALQGQTETGMAHIRQGLTTWRTTGAQNVLPYFLLLLAETYGATGQYNKGVAALDEALAVVNLSGERWWEAETYRLRGELLLRQTPPVTLQATVNLQQALHIAQHQQAKLWELRIVTTWKRLIDAQGGGGGARQLREVYAWFTEGFELADLQTAQQYIEESAGPGAPHAPVLLRDRAY
jgi:predicted ATPase/class 3 adenylate cyclase